MAASGAVVLPGDSLGKVSSKCRSGAGTFEHADGNITATLAGKINIETDASNINIISVLPYNNQNALETVISVGDAVIALVVRINTNQVFVDIIGVGDRILKFNAKGMIRREDVRPSDLDSLVMHQCFRPGDVIRATVISLGDAKQYFLSTAASDTGVVWAKSEELGNVMIPKGAEVKCKYNAVR